MAAPIRKTTKWKWRNYLSVKEWAWMTSKWRASYNKATGSNLKSPTKDKDNPRHKSFCSRSKSWKWERGKAARSRWWC